MRSSRHAARRACYNCVVPLLFACACVPGPRAAGRIRAPAPAAPGRGTDAARRRQRSVARGLTRSRRCALAPLRLNHPPPIPLSPACAANWRVRHAAVPRGDRPGQLRQQVGAAGAQPAHSLRRVLALRPTPLTPSLPAPPFARAKPPPPSSRPYPRPRPPPAARLYVTRLPRSPLQYARLGNGPIPEAEFSVTASEHTCIEACQVAQHAAAEAGEHNYDWRGCQQACFPPSPAGAVGDLALAPTQAAALQALQQQQQQQQARARALCGPVRAAATRALRADGRTHATLPAPDTPLPRPLRPAFFASSSSSSSRYAVLRPAHSRSRMLLHAARAPRAAHAARAHTRPLLPLSALQQQQQQQQQQAQQKAQQEAQQKAQQLAQQQ